MKNREALRLSVLRGLMSAATNELVAHGKKPTDELSEEDLLTLVSRARKQRLDSIEQFEKGGRQDLADKEKAELVIIEAMLPRQLSEAEIQTATKAKAAELGITDATKKNQLMGALMKDLKGRADGNLVKAAVEALFN